MIGVINVFCLSCIYLKPAVSHEQPTPHTLHSNEQKTLL